MSRNSNRTGQTPLEKRRIPPSRSYHEDRFFLINYEWFVPVPLLRRLSALSAENELESVVFPDEIPFDSHWQFFLEHQTHPPRLRLGLTLLGPCDRSIRADVKFVFRTTNDHQVIKENLFTEHTFFLGKGEAISSFINDQISPKVVLDIDGDLYEEVMSQTRQGNPFNTDDCTVLASVRVLNEFEIQPKSKLLDPSRRFTVDWNLKNFHHIIEQIKQPRLPMANERRLLSERFSFTHHKSIEGIKTKKWKLLIKCPSTPSTYDQTPLYLTLKCANSVQGNYGKVEIICKNEHNVLRRLMPDFQDLEDNYTFEFFTLEELASNIYTYRHDYSQRHGRYFTVEYLLLQIRIIQPLQPADLPRYIKRVQEPTVISLKSTGKLHSKSPGRLLKSELKEPRAVSVAKVKPKPIPPVMKSTTLSNPGRSPERRTRSQENMLNHSFDPLLDGARTHRGFPLITPRAPTELAHPSTRSRLQPTALPNIRDNSLQTPHSDSNPRQLRFAAAPRIRSMEQSKPVRSNGTALLSTSLNSFTQELPDNFDFLNHLFRTGLHSDVTIRSHDREWHLHKSILSARSNYFHQHFAVTDESELDLTVEDDTPSSPILDRIFLFIYTNQYRSDASSRRTSSPSKEKKRLLSSNTTTTATNSTSRETIHSLFDGSIKYGIDALTLICLQEMCHPSNITVQSAALLLASVQQALTGPFEKLHSNDYLRQMKHWKQIVLSFIQRHSREVLLSAQWKRLEKEYPYLVHDVLEFLVFQRIDE